MSAPTSEPLVTLGADGTFRPDASAAGTIDPLEALTTLRGLLGDDLEDGIATRMMLPAALGTEPADQLLPASLTLLADTAADLTSFGWRLGVGPSRAWARARDLRERRVEAAQVALFGLEKDLQVTALGPLTLATATFLPGGERTLADRGALRDLPEALAAGLSEHLADIRRRLPGARPRLLLREPAAQTVLDGTVPTVSGRQRHRALPAPELSPHWRWLRKALGEDATGLTLAVPPHPTLLAAATAAGITGVAVPTGLLGPLTGVEEVPPARRDRARRDRAAWEELARLHSDGVRLEILVDPRRAEAQVDAFAAAWQRLGFSARDLSGLTLLAHPAPVGSADPAREPTATDLPGSADITHLLRLAPAWAERVAGS
ncbi:hypothetical protein JSY14_02240 [Brachybacterium sp. EF45031]|uniref:hypothetical protein n=1 Tax=Brachybacterium sillae TaxID=2810536 RepID=UPI00217EC507|nr:hypothetical protein [Brachybacterium sillae]MCS6710894.1 hypothetical protein [Brachybacterium sillae]